VPSVLEMADEAARTKQEVIDALGGGEEVTQLLDD
jgi:hypothetical protein